MRPDDLVVAERVAETQHEVGLVPGEHDGDGAEHRDRRETDDEAPHGLSVVNSAMTPATHASRSSSVPVLT